MRALALLLVVALSGCAGLPRAREMGDMALLRTVGVDREGEELRLTASTGPRAKGLQAEGRAALVLTAAGSTLSQARRTLQGQGDSSSFFGYVDQLLLGEELARQGVDEVLDWFARDRELGLNARLWVMMGAAAREGVESGGEQGVQARLSAMNTQGEEGTALLSRSAGEVWTELAEFGSAWLPALSPGEDGRLTQRGYGVLKGDRLRGWLTGEAARGLELLLGRPQGEVLAVELSGQRAALRMTEGQTRFSLEEGGGLLVVHCRLQAAVEEYRTCPSEEERAALEQALESRARARMGAALDRLKDWQTDCVGIGASAAPGAPVLWQGLEDWPCRFGQIEVEIRVEASLRL